MKPIKWTFDKLKELTKNNPTPGKFKKANQAAYKSAREQGFLDILFPIRERPKPFTKEQLIEKAKQYPTRGAFQHGAPSMYNAARNLNLIEQLFPIQLNKKKWDKDTLAIEAAKHKTRTDFYKNKPGAYSIAVKKNLIEEICPPALQGTSTAELELLSWLQFDISGDFKTKRFSNDYELDCYSETLRVGVEYNGLYWHSEEHKDNSYHLKKTKYFEGLGIRIIHIWEHEWRDRQAQVKDYLRSACGKNQFRIGARKCEFKEINKNIAKDFLNETHIQGGVNAILFAIGCYHHDKLIGVCSFGKHHRNNKDIVLNRFACLPNYTVSGFLAKASKLAALKYGTIYSWAHYAKSQAKGYLSAGWKVVTVHKPDYFYVDPQSKIISKQARRKSAVNTPEGMTEREHAKIDGLRRVWDCGKILLIFSL